MSESLAHALQGRLTYDTASWDKLTALAWGSVTNAQRSARESLQNSLGVSLLGFKVAQRPDLFARAASGLQAFLAHTNIRVGLENRGKVARAAIREWILDTCETCNGVGYEFDLSGVQKVCGTCAGTARRKHTDAEREKELGFSGEKAERAMSAAHFIIATSVGFAVWQARERLKE